MITGTFTNLVASRHFEHGLQRGALYDRWTNLGYSRGAEIGVQCGYNVHFILERWSGFLLLVDTWIDNGQPDTPEKVCRKELAHLADRFQMLKMPSIEAAAQMVSGSLDCIYIDAEHTYEAVKADLATWYSVVRSGGMISGHDFGVRQGADNQTEHPQRLGVAEAVIEFTEAMGVTLYVCQNEGEWANWYFIKP